MTGPLDPMDEELRKLIKAEVDRSLRGWEFTPSMARQVLERIAADESGTGSAAAPDQVRRTRSRWMRTGAWGAVAAAAVLLVVYTGLDHLRPDSSDRPAPESEIAATVQKEPSATGFDRNREEAAGTAAPSDESAAAKAAVPEGDAGTLAVSPEAGVAAVVRDPESDGGVCAAAPGDQGEGTSGGPGVSVMSAEAFEPADPPSHGKWVRLPVPAVAAAPRAFGALATTSDAGDLEARAPGGRRVEWSDTGVRLVEAGGTVVWEVPLAGPLGSGQLAVSPSGRVAVSSGSRLYLLDASGRLEQTITIPAEPVEVLWAGPDLLVVADGTRVILCRNGVVLWTAPFPARGLDALAGSPVVLTWNDAEAVALELTTGREVWRAVPDQPGPVMIRGILAPEGHRAALLASADGGYVLWVLDGAGNLLLAEGLAAEPQIDFQGGQVRVVLPDAVRVYSLSP